MIKLIFLGSGSASVVGCDNYQSNMVFETNDKRLLIDCGTDIRFSLFDQGLSHQAVQAVFLSHLHSDHVGGVEWLAFKSKFESATSKKPDLFISKTMVDALWNNVLSGGLSSLQGVDASLSTYFDVHAISEDSRQFQWEGMKFNLIKTLHCMSGSEAMPSYGIFVNTGKQKVLITGDTQFSPETFKKYYQEADIIFHDTETSSHTTGVHARYEDLCTLPAEIKKKMWLYHCNGEMQRAKADDFLGFVKKGQEFIF